HYPSRLTCPQLNTQIAPGGNIKIHCRCAGSANSAPPSALFFNTLFTHAFFLIAKNDFLFGDSFPLWERNGVKQKQRDGV
ncbi:hypothetical protein AB4124_34150, partial [Paenibacillus sp. 2KB_20]|uniref:hypothetical protein n=1 Tax=Paenibacillus sp. 2KB_20 TaxID=3232977 RepID=UPI003F9E61A2